MVDAILYGTVSTIVNELRARTLKRLGHGDAIFRAVTKASAIGVLIVLGAIFVSLVMGGALAFQTFGLNFFVTEAWNPVTENFGARAPIVGTLITSFIAMLIAVPIGLGAAIFLTELCPPMLRRPIGIAIELLAGVPSIIYGIWGLFIFAPFLQAHVQPALISAFGNVPVLFDPVCRAALRHRRFDRQPDPGDHGASLHHGRKPRRVRHRAGAAEGIPPLASAARLGR